MNKTIKHVSDNTLLAMYLALRAARTGARRVYVTNDALKSHLRTQRVHKPRIHKFAETLQTIFPHHSVGKEHYKLKNGLFLYFTKEQYGVTRTYRRNESVGFQIKKKSMKLFPSKRSKWKSRNHEHNPLL